MPSEAAPFIRHFPNAIDQKSVDESGDTGHFSGYLSRWGEEDSYGDVFEKGAFKDSLKANPRFQIPGHRTLLWQHITHEPIGILKAKEDSEGLFIESEVALDVQRGKEAMSLIKRKAVTGLSHGFNPVEWKQRKSTAGQSGRSYKKAELWEGSPVTFPALPTAQILQVNSATPGGARSVDEEVALELASWLKARRSASPRETPDSKETPAARNVDVEAITKAVLARIALT